MTREDVLKLFPEATDDQITNLLNQNNSEVAKEKNKASQYKAKADTADDLQKKLDDLQAGNMTELEKANKALETANQHIADLEKNNALRDQREALMEKIKINAEQAKSIIKDDGSFDYDVLGQITADKEKTAIAEYEKKALKDTPNPNNGGGKPDEKTEAEKIASNLIQGKASNNDVLSHYI